MRLQKLYRVLPVNFGNFLTIVFYESRVPHGSMHLIMEEPLATTIIFDVVPTVLHNVEGARIMHENVMNFSIQFSINTISIKMTTLIIQTRACPPLE